MTIQGSRHMAKSFQEMKMEQFVATDDVHQMKMEKFVAKDNVHQLFHQISESYMTCR